MQEDLTRQVLKLIREYINAEKISMSEFARQTGISKAWLSKLKNSDANLSLDTAQDLLHYMGYTLKLTREGSCSIQPSRLKKYASNVKTAAKIYIIDKFNVVENDDTTKEGASFSEVSTSTNTVYTQPQNINNGNPIKLNPGQSIIITANKNNRFYKFL